MSNVSLVDPPQLMLIEEIGDAFHDAVSLPLMFVHLSLFSNLGRGDFVKMLIVERNPLFDKTFNFPHGDIPVNPIMFQFSDNKICSLFIRGPCINLYSENPNF